MNIGDKAPEILGKDEEAGALLLPERQHQRLHRRGLQPARQLRRAAGQGL